MERGRRVLGNRRRNRFENESSLAWEKLYLCLWIKARSEILGSLEGFIKLCESSKDVIGFTKQFQAQLKVSSSSELAKEIPWASNAFNFQQKWVDTCVSPRDTLAYWNTEISFSHSGKRVRNEQHTMHAGCLINCVSANDVAENVTRKKRFQRCNLWNSPFMRFMQSLAIFLLSFKASFLSRLFSSAWSPCFVRIVFATSITSKKNLKQDKKALTEY